MDILDEITAAGHHKFITAFLSVAAGVKFHRQVNSPRDVHLVLQREETDSLQLNWTQTVYITPNFWICSHCNSVSS